MANRKFVKNLVNMLIGLIIICPIFVCPITGLAYSDDTTHRAITNESIKIFNHFYPDLSLSIADRESIIKGSKDEDTPPRWLNHFYDPIYQQGFRGLLTSKNWAQNTTAQALLLNKNPLAEYFSSPTDYSWERAIYDYVYGDRSRGLEALGHTLHLIQDATVPDHTRDDAHPIWSTYEKYAKRFDINNVSLAENLLAQNQKPIIFSDLDSYFDYLANFSNTNFFSDDTILIYSYDKPVVKKEKLESWSNGQIYRFGYGPIEDVRLVGIDKVRNFINGKVENSYFLYDSNNLIPASYWQNLSPKAVLASAGVIKLFFDEVEKEKQTKRLFEKNKSFVQKFLDNLNNGLGNLLASVNLVTEQTTSGRIDSLNDSESITNEVRQLAEKEIAEDDLPVKLSSAEIEKELGRIKEEIANLLQSPEAANLLISSTTKNILLIKNFIPSGSAQTISEIIDSASSTNYLTISAPTVLSPANFFETFSTTTIIFSGTTTPGTIVFNDFNLELATSSNEGFWSITLNNLSQGSNIIKFFARDLDGAVSLPTEVTLQIDSLPLGIDLLIDNCVKSLSSDFCLLKPTSTLNFNWSPTKAGNYSYDLIKTEKDRWDGWQGSETIINFSTNTETTTGLNFTADDLLREFKWQIIAREASSSEVVATSSELITIFHPRPIVINEIGWAGTTASGRDEWLELKNYLTNYSLDLTDYYLTDLDKSWQIDLVGRINAGDYYLIERGSDEVISNRLAHLIDNFNSDLEEKIFNPSSLGLRLWHKTVDGDELVDETPTWDKSQSGYGSLERTWENRISSDPSTWESNDGCNEEDGPCALDRNGISTFGTPGVINFNSIPRLW